MALREFRDSDGTEWLAWDVPPSQEYPRVRSGEDRRVSATPGFLPERRVRERRLRRVSELEKGWVCFQSPHGKRRLAPPPPGWDSAPDEALVSLCATAQPARTRT
jgi:hypothetical protein